MANLERYKKEQYINVETFRKNGAGVKTPVWFVEFNGKLCFTTEAGSGKVKRMHNNPSVNITPCKMDGTVTGEWQPAAIRFMQADEVQAMDKAYSKKYGLMKVLFELPKIFSKKPERSFIAISLQ
jgi:PPOX class probable F420-dependent enzyme